MAVIENLSQVNDTFECRPLNEDEQKAWAEATAYRDPYEHEQRMSSADRMAALAVAQEVGLVRPGPVRTFNYR